MKGEVLLEEAYAHIVLKRDQVADKIKSHVKLLNRQQFCALGAARGGDTVLCLTSPFSY